MSRARPEDLIRYQTSFQDCQGHGSCNRFVRRLRQSTPPRRLLYIKPGSSPRLCTISKGQCPRYAALTYRWGPTTPQQERSKTVMRNVEDRHISVHLPNIPRTISDAIKVTQVLELFYLWVDAFCIIQDDDTDKVAEGKATPPYKPHQRATRPGATPRQNNGNAEQHGEIAVLMPILESFFRSQGTQ